jgi:hypothetical protein
MYDSIDELARQSLDEGDDPLSISYLKRKLEHITLLRSRILSNFISSLQDPSFQSVGSAASVLEEFTEAIRQVTDQQQRSLQAIDAVQNDKRFIIQDGTSSSSPMTKEKRTVAKQVDDSLAKLILNLQTTIARAQLCQQNLAQLLSGLILPQLLSSSCKLIASIHYRAHIGRRGEVCARC